MSNIKVKIKKFCLPLKTNNFYCLPTLWEVRWWLVHFFTLTVALCSQVYKWVVATLVLGVTLE